MGIKENLVIVKDFPKKGVDFADITSIIANGKLYRKCIDDILSFLTNYEVDKVVGPEARGFITGCPVAYGLSKGFVPVRKSGKLPREVLNYEYKSEYEKSYLEIHENDISPGDKVVIVDDVLATGGTVASIEKMIKELGAEVIAIVFLLEIKELKGIEKLNCKSDDIKILESI